MVTDALLCTLRHVVETLYREEITWALAGGVALSVWDHSRSTRDIDFLLGVRDRDIDQMLAALRAADLKPKRDTPPDRYIDIQVDCIFADLDFQERALTRRVGTQFPDMAADFYVLCCEDLIVFKLVAGRIIDLADAAALLRANRGSIDFDVLRSECVQTNLSDEVAGIWSEAFSDEVMPRRDA